AGLGSYTISYVNGTLNVTAKALTITADSDASAGNGQTAFSKVYGSVKTYAGTEFTASGLVNGDTVTSVSLSSSGDPATAAVGAYTVTIGSAIGSGLGNYTISFVNGTLNVTAKAPTITADSDANAGNGQTAFSKVYGGGLTCGGIEFTSSSPGYVYNGASLTICSSCA